MDRNCCQLYCENASFALDSAYVNETHLCRWDTSDTSRIPPLWSWKHIFGCFLSFIHVAHFVLPSKRNLLLHMTHSSWECPLSILFSLKDVTGEDFPSWRWSSPLFSSFPSLFSSLCDTLWHKNHISSDNHFAFLHEMYFQAGQQKSFHPYIFKGAMWSDRSEVLKFAPVCIHLSRRKHYSGFPKDICVSSHVTGFYNHGCFNAIYKIACICYF